MHLNYNGLTFCVLSLFMSCYTFSYELSNESIDDSYYVYKDSEFINTLKPGGVLELPGDEEHIVELANVKAPTLSYKVNITDDGIFYIVGDSRPTGIPTLYYANTVLSHVKLFIDGSRSKLIVKDGFMEVNHYHIIDSTLAIKATVKENKDFFNSHDENIQKEIFHPGTVGDYIFERHAQL